MSSSGGQTIKLIIRQRPGDTRREKSPWDSQWEASRRGAGEPSVKGFAAGLLDGQHPMASTNGRAGPRIRGEGAGGTAFWDWSVAVSKSSPTRRPKWVAALLTTGPGCQVPGPAKKVAKILGLISLPTLSRLFRPVIPCWMESFSQAVYPFLNLQVPVFLFLC